MTTERPPPVLSVVIACLDAEETLGEQLDALAGQRWDRPWELVVADNGSRDGTRALLDDYSDRFPALRVVDASARRGQPYAMNEGAQAARGEFLAFVDADDVVGEGWLAAIGDAVLRHDLVAGRLSVRELNEAWAAAERRTVQTADLQHGRYPPFLPHAGSGTLAVRKSLHLEHGGFDESGPALFDTDYCYRLQLAGVELHFEPRAVIHYRTRASLRAIYRQMRSYAEGDAWLQARYGRPRGWRVCAWPCLYWFAILRSLGRAWTPEGRARTAWLLGWQAGRYRGSLKHRVLAV